MKAESYRCDKCGRVIHSREDLHNEPHLYEEKLVNGETLTKFCGTLQRDLWKQYYGVAQGHR